MIPHYQIYIYILVTTLFCFNSIGSRAELLEDADSLAITEQDSLSRTNLKDIDEERWDKTVQSLYATQQTIIPSVPEKSLKRDWTTWKPDPKRAMWLAIVLPGAGQIYNRKYWKLPIIYGGFLGCIYAMRWNNQMYMDYSQAYIDITDEDPNTKSYTQFLHLGTEITTLNEKRYISIFKSRRDKYRRWRDLSFFVLLGVYALSIVDAYVDASLSSFDISDDLTLHLEPTVINNSKTKNALGIKGALNF